MLTVAYIANQFPSGVEPYVVEEIEGLRRSGVEVIVTSGKRIRSEELPIRYRELAQRTTFLHPPVTWHLLRAVWLCSCKIGRLIPLLRRVLFQGSETPRQRLHALGHTLLGACYALQLAGREVQQVHAHHGYFASWVAMVAARLVGIGFSFTLHGSDLLLNPAYLDVKLQECSRCFTISEFNRRHLLHCYPHIEASKIVLRRLGVDAQRASPAPERRKQTGVVLFAAGRLHPVKDHAFLIRACFLLKQRGLQVQCSIAGNGPEHDNLQQIIRELHLEGDTKLLGHVERDKLTSYYKAADIVVLTSKSEGIPLVLMEAMAAGAIALAPDITGIPELVIPGQTGFLYTPESLEDFVKQVTLIHRALPALGSIRQAARTHVSQHFDRAKNLDAFVVTFLQQLSTNTPECVSHENSLLQQI